MVLVPVQDTGKVHQMGNAVQGRLYRLAGKTDFLGGIFEVESGNAGLYRRAFFPQKAQIAVLAIMFDDYFQTRDTAIVGLDLGIVGKPIQQRSHPLRVLVFRETAGSTAGISPDRSDPPFRS